MPYIPRADRACVLQGQPVSAGDLNFKITTVIHDYIRSNGLCYPILNEAIGVLECAKLELYRMVAVPYEDIKRKENGPVSELDEEKTNG